MERCILNHNIKEDFIPPMDCKCMVKPISCKLCNNYNPEYDLIERSIDSAQSRIYKINIGKSSMSEGHQKKIENQEEIMNITIKALEFYKKHH